MDEYVIKDDGARLNFRERTNLGANMEGVNFESVLTSQSMIGNRKIDVVISPSILKKAGLLYN